MSSARRSIPPLASEIFARMAAERSRYRKLGRVGASAPMASAVLSRLGQTPDGGRKTIPAPPLASEIQSRLKATRLAAPHWPASSRGGRSAQAHPIQRVKIYPNLHAGANTPIDRNNVFFLQALNGQYRARQGQGRRWFVPNLKYNFVTTMDGSILMHHRYRHPPLAGGKPVLYAGEAVFENGKLAWWSNASGHYRPDDEGARQANLPMDQFYSYDQVLKGEHKRKRALAGGGRR